MNKYVMVHQYQYLTAEYLCFEHEGNLLDVQKEIFDIAYSSLEKELKNKKYTGIFFY